MSGSGRPQVVINADDLGRTQNVNDAILASFQDGLITSASLMANMAGFADAVAMIAGASLHDAIGIHLNLTQGHALSAGVRESARFCDDAGEFLPRGATVWRLSAQEEQTVEAEFAAQIDAVITAGIRPSHLDSHHHFHTQWPIAPILIRLARRYDIPAVRLSRNCGPSPSPSKRVYKSLVNMRLIRAGVAPTRHFGNAYDAASLTRFDGPVEVMVHPELDRDDQVVDVPSGGGVEGGVPLRPVSQHWRQIGTLVSFRELCSPWTRG